MNNFIDRYTNMITVFLSLIQTIVIVSSMSLVYVDLKNKESDGFYNQQEESLNLYRSYKGITSGLRQFSASLANPPEEEDLSSAMWRYIVPIESDVNEMYTAFEMCLKVGRCDKGMLLELACDDAIDVSQKFYQSYGDILFDAYNNNIVEEHNNNIVTELQFNIFHFTSRCSKRPHSSLDLKWLDDYKIIMAKKE